MAEPVENTETPVVEIKAPVENTPVVDTTKLTPPVETAPVSDNNEPSFDIDLDVTDEPVITDKVKFKKDQFKDLDDDIYDGDDEVEFDTKTAALVEKLVARGKEYKGKANEYKTLAEANKTISEDPHIKFYSEIHDAPDEQVVLQKEYAKYKAAGKSDDDALKMAQSDVDELKEESEKLFAKAAKDRRLELQGYIHNRSKEIQSNISKTAQALSLSNAPNPELLTKATEHLSKLDNFLGLKFGGKNETSKKDFTRSVESAIKDGSLLKKIQSDPQLLAEIGLYVEHKAKFTKAVENRKPTKLQEKEKLAKAPHSDGKPPVVTDIEAKEGSGLKNPKGFR